MKVFPRTSICVCSVLLCSIVFVITPRSRKTTVAPDYEPAVQNLMAGRGLLDVHGHVITRTPPLYPVTLSAIRRAARTVDVSESILLFAFATACLAGASACAYELASLIAGHRGAWVAALLFTIHPHVLFGVIEPLSETPFLLMLYAAVLSFIGGLTPTPVPGGRDSAHPWVLSPGRRAWLLFAAGTLSGVAILIRPAGVFVPLIMAALVFVGRRLTVPQRLQAWMLLAAGVMLAVLPWEVFVWRHSGQLILVSSHGVHTMRDGFTFNNKTMRRHIWIPTGAERVVDDVWSRYDQLTDYPSVARLIIHEVRTNPTGLLELYLYKAIRSWYGVDSQQRGKELMNALVLVFYLVPAGIGMRRYFRSAGGSRDRRHDHRYVGDELEDDAGRRRVAGVVFAALILYFWGMTILTLSIARYMVPTIAFVCAFIPLSMPPSRVAIFQAAHGPSIQPWPLASGSWRD